MDFIEGTGIVGKAILIGLGVGVGMEVASRTSKAIPTRQQLKERKEQWQATGSPIESAIFYMEDTVAESEIK